MQIQSVGRVRRIETVLGCLTNKSIYYKALSTICNLNRMRLSKFIIKRICLRCLYIFSEISQTIYLFLNLNAKEDPNSTTYMYFCIWLDKRENCKRTEYRYAIWLDITRHRLVSKHITQS